MAHTVIGFFEDAASAQQAMQQLERIGIPRHDIDVSSSGALGAGGEGGERSDDRNENRGSGIQQFFTSLFGSESDDADRHIRVGRSGCVIVTVHAQTRGEAERAADILDACGAIDVDEKALQLNNTNAQRESEPGPRPVNHQRDEHAIPTIQQQVEIGKRTVEQEGVRVRSRIVERPVEEQVRLREEHIRIERQPVNRPVSDTEWHHFQEGDIEFTEHAEVPVVNKEARVVEEIRLRKDVTERDATVRDTVRNTEVDVDSINQNDPHRGRMDSDFSGPRNL